MDPQLLRLAHAVRESTLSRLRNVPIGAENWRIDPKAMSFADTAQHLLDADAWLFEALRTKTCSKNLGRAHLLEVSDRQEFDAAIDRLRESGERRVALMEHFHGAELEAPISAPWGTVTAWWLIMRNNLDHEIHHRGQIAAYLRVLATVMGRSS